MVFRGTWITNPTPWPRPDETWIWSYNRELIGKDRIYAGPGQVPAYDWPLPNPGYYFDISLRTWTSHYNYNLIGKDKFYDGPGYGPVFDYPNPRGYEPDWRRSWEWSYNKNLIGKDKFYDGPGKGPEFDYPNPQPVTWYRSLEVNLLQSTLSIAPQPKNQKDWPLPGQPPRSDQFWTGNNPGNLLAPFREQDWPNPQPTTWYKSWEAWYNLNLIGQDKFPARQSDYPNPQPVQWYKDWSVNLLQTTLFIPPQAPFAQYDWPVPVGYPYYLNYGQESFFVEISPSPFAQYDWPITQPPLQYRDWFQNLLQNTLSTPPPVVNPFVQTDWPNYRSVTWYQDWAYKYIPELVGQDKFPPRQQDWPNPTPPYRLDQYWSNSLVPGGLLPPFRQQYWPNPYPVQWYQTYEYKYIPELIGQDKLPFRQSDYPNPYPVTWYQDYRVSLLQTTLFVTPAPLPFNQYDWPNPRDYQRQVDQNNWYYVSPFIPPTPPPPVVQGGGWTDWTEVDVANAANFWKKTAKLESYYGNIRQAAQELGQKGGQARMKTMTAFERQTYARKAAEARWKPK